MTSHISEWIWVKYVQELNTGIYIFHFIPTPPLILFLKFGGENKRKVKKGKIREKRRKRGEKEKGHRKMTKPETKKKKRYIFPHPRGGKISFWRGGGGGRRSFLKKYIYNS